MVVLVTKRQRLWLLLSCFLVAIFVALFVGFSKSRSLLSAHEDTEKSKPAAAQRKDVIFHKYGWEEAVHQYRLVLTEAAVKMKQQHLQQDDETIITDEDSYLVNIKPFHDIISLGLDTFGVIPMYSEVFHDIEWYFPEKWYRPKSNKKEARCNWHGIGCEYYDLWFIWHYVGVVSAEKLLQEKSLLLDSITGKRLSNAVELMDVIHALQERPFVTRMSFHAQHGFIWAYLAATRPNLDSYPTKLANDFCGKYNEKHYVRSVKKYIGTECHHGFGHGIYEILAWRQLISSKGNTNALGETLRAKSGFVLTDEAFCQGYRICQEAPEYPTSIRKHCHGGMVHAAWLFGPPGVLPKSKKAVDGLFQKVREKCELTINSTKYT